MLKVDYFAGGLSLVLLPDFPTSIRLFLPHLLTVAGVSVGGNASFHKFGEGGIVHQIKEIMVGT